MPYENPVLLGTHQDPTVVRLGSTYYLATSTFEYFPALPLFRSTDLQHWEPIGHAIDRIDQVDLSEVESSQGIFAPTLRYNDGVRYLICTLFGAAEHEQTFVLTATDPEGSWSDPIWLDGVRGYDPSLLFAGDGRVWCTGTQLIERDWPEQAAVWLQEFDLERMTLVGERHEIWTGAAPGVQWAEGPQLYDVDGWFYLLVSEGGTEYFHALVVARSRTVTGPYAGSVGNPILTHRHLGRAGSKHWTRRPGGTPGRELGRGSPRHASLRRAIRKPRTRDIRHRRCLGRRLAGIRARRRQKQPPHRHTRRLRLRPGLTSGLRCEPVLKDSGPSPQMEQR